MREAINENPRVQLALFAVAGLILVLFVVKPFGGAEEPAPPAATGEVAIPEEGVASPPTGTPAPATPAPGGGATAPPTSTPAVEPDASAPVAPPSGAGLKLVASPGFPAAVVKALRDGDLVVLFVYDPAGFPDEELRRYTERLRGDPRLRLIEVKEKDVAKYSRILGTGGLEVDRAPALVTVAPPESRGAEPIATVTYGFRRPKSVRQAVDDALFEGKSVTSFPR